METNVVGIKLFGCKLFEFLHFFRIHLHLFNAGESLDLSVIFAGMTMGVGIGGLGVIVKTVTTVLMGSWTCTA